MPLKIDTFSNIKGGNSLYKALVHPLAAEKAKALINAVAAAGPIAIYDPRDTLANLAELYDIGAWDIQLSSTIPLRRYETPEVIDEATVMQAKVEQNGAQQENTGNQVNKLYRRGDEFK